MLHSLQHLIHQLLRRAPVVVLELAPEPVACTSVVPSMLHLAISLAIAFPAFMFPAAVVTYLLEILHQQ